MGITMKRSKRAVVEVQFNWIFILIAGALILFLFASIILKQKNTTDSAAQTELLKTVTSLAIGSESSTGVTSVVDLGDATLTFGCNTLRIGQKSQPIQQMVMFSPSSVRTPLILSTREWSLPFRVTNVIYLSSPRIRYVLIGNNDLARQINQSMPDKFLVDYYPSFLGTGGFSSSQMQKDDRLRIVVFEGNGVIFDQSQPSTTIHPQLSTIPQQAISLLYVRESTTSLNHGDIEFFQKTQNGWSGPTSVTYLKQEMLMGAIFTDKAEQYQCIQSNMLKKLSTVAQIQETRKNILDTQTTNHQTLSRCHTNDYYADSSPHFMILISSTDFSSLYNSAHDSTSSLTTINKNLERASCPLLY
jgi:hypothetical protein